MREISQRFFFHRNTYDFELRSRCEIEYKRWHGGHTVHFCTGLCISSCKKFEETAVRLRKPRSDEVRPRFSRKISKFEGSPRFDEGLEIENHTVSNKGWTLVHLLVKLEFNRGSTAVRPIFGKVEQISSGLASSSTEGFFTFGCPITRSAIKVELVKNDGQTTVKLRLNREIGLKSDPRFDFPQKLNFFCRKWKNKRSGKSNLAKPQSEPVEPRSAVEPFQKRKNSTFFFIFTHLCTAR
jgi:hypothetical protein